CRHGRRFCTAYSAKPVRRGTGGSRGTHSCYLGEPFTMVTFMVRRRRAWCTVVVNAGWAGKWSWGSGCHRLLGALRPSSTGPGGANPGGVGFVGRGYRAVRLDPAGTWARVDGVCLQHGVELFRRYAAAFKCHPCHLSLPPHWTISCRRYFLVCGRHPCPDCHCLNGGRDFRIPPSRSRHRITRTT